VAGVSAAVPVTIDSLAVGGEGVGRLADGRAVFVAGTLPQESVLVELTTTKARWARARLLEVLDPSAQRRPPPCPWHNAGCGGCDLMHASVALQREARVQLAREALQRLGRIAEPLVLPGPPLPDRAVRTTLRVAVLDGRAAYRRRSSHDLVAVGSCLIAHPGLQELLAEGHFGQADEAVLRISAATGQRLAVVAPHAGGVRLPADVAVIGRDELRAAPAGSPGRRARRRVADGALWEDVAGHRWRVSAGSFFQPGPAGAEALVSAVRAALQADPAGRRRAGSRVLDAYCGIGLLSAAFDHAAEVVAVESSPPSVADAELNLAALARARSAPAPRVVAGRLERWAVEPVDAVVADPARRGLGRPGADVLAATGAATVVLVSCDLASLGRDSAELVARGYRHAGSTVLDLFPHTAHAEVVTRFTAG
jgi:tRNA/tmRNA/rRNA uracil-C5-methylase (TrmA/RlmC/RlmD family)